MAGRKYTEAEKKKKAKGLCITPYCTSKARYGGSMCHPCRNKAFRQKDPLKYAYQTLKDNAKRRGKDFTLTFEYFCELAKQIDYMNKKGTKAKSMQIDRKDEERGYHNDNVQGLTLAENRYKYDQYKHEKTYGVAPF